MMALPRNMTFGRNRLDLISISPSPKQYGERIAARKKKSCNKKNKRRANK